MRGDTVLVGVCKREGRGYPTCIIQYQCSDHCSLILHFEGVERLSYQKRGLNDDQKMSRYTPNSMNCPCSFSHNGQSSCEIRSEGGGSQLFKGYLIYEC